jgi:hypothetical protein
MALGDVRSNLVLNVFHDIDLPLDKKFSTLCVLDKPLTRLAVDLLAVFVTTKFFNVLNIMFVLLKLAILQPATAIP